MACIRSASVASGEPNSACSRDIWTRYASNCVAKAAALANGVVEASRSGRRAKHRRG